MNLDKILLVKYCVGPTSQREGIKMRKILIVSMIVLSGMMIFAAFQGNLGDMKQPAMPQRPIGGKPGPAIRPYYPMFGPQQDFLLWIYKNLPDFEIETTIKDVEIVNGEVFVTVEATDETYMVFIPSALLRFFKLDLSQGDKIKVVGKKLVLKEEILIIPEKLNINGKKFDIKTLRQKYR